MSIETEVVITTANGISLLSEEVNLSMEMYSGGAGDLLIRVVQNMVEGFYLSTGEFS